MSNNIKKTYPNLKRWKKEVYGRESAANTVSLRTWEMLRKDLARRKMNNKNLRIMLTDINPKLPMREEVMAAQNANGDEVMDGFLFDNFTRDVLFLKQMTHHLVDMDLRFLEQTKNIILIRDPKKVLHSYGKVIAEPTLEDIGIKQSFELIAAAILPQEARKMMAINRPTNPTGK